VCILLLPWSVYAHNEAGGKMGGLIAVAFDDTGFQRAFKVFETGDLSSEKMKWPTKNDWSMKCMVEFVVVFSTGSE